MGGRNTSKADYDVVPLPKEITQETGEAFSLTSATKIIYPEGYDKMKRNAEFLAEYINIATGLKTSVSTESLVENAIILATGLDSDNLEAYNINVNSKTITITGATEAGVFYGIQTLRKATPIEKAGTVQYSAVNINDEPRFGYRGMSLDVARHFQPVDFVKKYIDMLALHNVNRFHWHLTEDQGWRIEIDSYPKLTEIGSMRSETVIGRNSGEYDGIPHGGYYTKEELRDVVEYAKERYITVIPEVDLPGHMLAALTAYPELGCTGGPYKVVGEWGVFDDILCAGNDETFTFLEAVLTEVMEIFPSEYIHIGGDE
ncbi:MAG: beta-N-acetylhexosaminidase, partial [Fermentimonas sp.]|nr:beta-N-acetylhexosaminidase [Fermentimonas sp.]